MFDKALILCIILWNLRRKRSLRTNTHSMRTHDKWKDETQIAKPFKTDDNFFERIARAIRTAYEQHTNGYRFKNGKP